MNAYTIPGVKVSIDKMDTHARIEYIKMKVCEYFGVRMQDVMIDAREGDAVHMRYIMMYFLRRHTSLSLKKIGNHVKIGGFDHTGVMAGIEKVTDQLTAKLPNRFQKDVPALEKLYGL